MPRRTACLLNLSVLLAGLSGISGISGFAQITNSNRICITTVPIIQLQERVDSFYGGIWNSGPSWTLAVLSNPPGQMLCRAYLSLIDRGALGTLQNVTLAWDPSIDPSVTGYNIYYGEASAIYTSKLDAGNATSIVISNLAVNTTYYFAVTAYDATGLESDPSNEINYTPSNGDAYAVYSQALVCTNLGPSLNWLPLGTNTPVISASSWPLDLTNVRSTLSIGIISNIPIATNILPPLTNRFRL